MTDQLNGLRFDIYERVHLPDDVAAIDELEEIELVPHMQAIPQDDQVLLRGHLLLSGVYRSQESTGASQLEHWIPVEISLPLNRIQSVEQLAVEIDNFDVDLLTTRSLNVTGVLALRGLQAQAAQSPIWRDDSFTVIHQAELEQAEFERAELKQDELDQAELKQAEFIESSTQLDNEESALLSSETEQERDDDWGLQSETDALLASEPPKESNWLSMFKSLEDSRKDQAAEQTQVDNSGWGDVTIERLADEADSSGLKLEHERVPQLDLEPLPAQEIVEKPDLKVALGGKALDSIKADLESSSGMGLLSQLGDKGAKRETELRIQEAAEADHLAQAAKQASQSTGDDLEWTRLFLNNGSESQSFRKVKMCIVQREETLDLIANRYNVQPRELQLYNRLNEPYLSEGQVLYIP